MAWHDAFQLSQQRSHFVPVYLTEFNMRRLRSSHDNLVEDEDEQLLLQSECFSVPVLPVYFAVFLSSFTPVNTLY